MQQKDNFVLYDDFFSYNTGDQWTDLAADAGVTAPAVGDVVGGRLSMATGATDNNEVAAKTTEELFLIADSRPIIGEARIQFTEANTDDANVLVGFMSALGANAMVDDGAGPRTTGNYACLTKRDGETVWRCSSRNGTESNETVSTKTAGGTAFQDLRIEIADWTGTKVSITYYVDGERLKDSNGNEITHELTITGSTEMNFGMYIKAGGANSETLVTDYASAWQVRY
jgi:hypothetical protein